MGQASQRFAVSELPEFNVFVFAFLLNHPWELIQVPLYAGMAAAPHWDAVKTCTRATVGDGFIMLLGYWGAAIVERDRWWIVKPRAVTLLALIGIGVAITMLLERFAIVSEHSAWGWRYAEAMPVVPGLASASLHSCNGLCCRRCWCGS